jgi:hypothetical protein
LEEKMKVGDLIRSKNDDYFEEMGYAVITKHNGGDVVFVWLSDETDVYMRWWELERWMVLA